MCVVLCDGDMRLLLTLAVECTSAAASHSDTQRGSDCERHDHRMCSAEDQRCTADPRTLQMSIGRFTRLDEPAGVMFAVTMTPKTFDEQALEEDDSSDSGDEDQYVYQICRVCSMPC